MMSENIFNEKHICDYGCGREAKYQFKNGKWCCEDYHNKCPEAKLVCERKYRKGRK